MAHAVVHGTAELPELRRAGTPSLGEPGGGVKLPAPLGVPDRFDGQGRPLPPDPAWVEYLTARARERGVQLRLPLDEGGDG